jgi:nicotinamidase-related amidase
MRNVLISIPVIIVIIIGLFAFNLILYKKNVNSISLGTEIKSDVINKPALLVVDIQEGTTGEISDIENYKRTSGPLINKINQLIDSAGKYSIPVIYIRNEVSNYLINLINSRLAEGGPGVAMDKRLKKISGYLIMNDKMDAFSNPGFDSILINRGINKLYFTGLDPAYSIGNTVVAARNRNYKVGLIKDALESESGLLKQKKLEEFRDKGCEVISSDEYFKKLVDTGY